MSSFMGVCTVILNRAVHSSLPIAVEGHTWKKCLQALPVRVEATFLLSTLNEHLSRTALIVQPLVLPSDTDIGES